VHGMAAIRRPRLVIAALFWTTISWIVLGLSTWFVLRGFRLGLSPVAGTLIVIAVALALILPSSPAAVGVFEAAVLVALKAYKVPSSTALSCALVVHVVNLVPYLVAGMVILMHRTSRRGRPAAAPP